MEIESPQACTENVFEELDNPGEYFFDRDEGKLYLFYNGTGTPPSDSVVAPQDSPAITIASAVTAITASPSPATLTNS